MRHIGFTGTREGMQEAQRAAVADLLSHRTPAWLHHGDCVGADAEVHAIGKSCGFLLVGHPSSRGSQRAWCDGFERLYHAKDYLQRNHDIVDLTCR